MNIMQICLKSELCIVIKEQMASYQKVTAITSLCRKAEERADFPPKREKKTRRVKFLCPQTNNLMTRSNISASHQLHYLPTGFVACWKISVIRNISGSVGLFF